MKERILVTGAHGAIGSALLPHLKGTVRGVDIEDADITVRRQVRWLFEDFKPTLIYHLAGAKSAPEGETNPARALAVNGLGTANVLLEAGTARVITASTCKACNPETAYGASKLLAEKLTVQAGGSIARFYNIRECDGNVLDIWGRIPEGEALPVTPCWRYFISMEQAVALLLAIPELPPGRYTIDPGKGRSMQEWAQFTYPGRAQVHIPPRRGDRLIEPRHAENERLRVLGFVPYGASSRTTGTIRVESIESTHDRGKTVSPKALSRSQSRQAQVLELVAKCG